MVPVRHFELENDLRRCEALLQLTELLANEGDAGEVLLGFSERLRRLIAFDLLSVSFHDPTQDVIRLHSLKLDQAVPSIVELPVRESLEALVWEHQEVIELPAVEEETRFRHTVQRLKQNGIRSYCALPITAAERRFGVLGIGRSQAHAYTETEKELLWGVANLLALELKSTLSLAAFQHEAVRLETLLQLSAVLMSTLDLQDHLLPAISEFVGKAVEQDFACVALYDQDDRRLRLCPLDSPLAQELIPSDTSLPLTEAFCGQAFLHGAAMFYQREDLSSSASSSEQRLADAGIQSLCCLPLITRKGTRGTLSLGSKQAKAFLARDMSFLTHVASLIAIALDNVEAYREITDLSEKLKKEKLYLQDELWSGLDFEDIIGESQALKRVLAQVNTVAPSDATVLILGETGTGKELIAHAIHRRSSRKDSAFVKLNCAAIPTGLLESELFGHEKGAFTGAVAQKIGRLELADKGTLLLDEIGDIPLELQPKLLRVLQDQEFERLGGNRTIKVDIRLIAATNRDLAKSVADREFRSDLFYRIHVFPLRMPALRERGKDISLLVRYFVQKFARRMNKRIENIPAEAMRALESWHWPGNVRELENLIERSVILTEGSTLVVPLSELRPPFDSSPPDSTLERLEREHILRVLRETDGVIAGVHGAAARLGMKRTTLQSRIQKMGITRQDYQN